MIEALTNESPSLYRISQMAQILRTRLPKSGDFSTAIPNLSLHRRNRPTETIHCIYTLGLALTLGGSKTITSGQNELSYGAGQSLLVSLDLPVSYRIRRATPSEPYLALMLKIDLARLAQAAAALASQRDESQRQESPRQASRRGSRASRPSGSPTSSRSNASPDSLPDSISGSLSDFVPLSVERLDARLLDTLYRLLLALDEPSLLGPLTPLLEQEVLLRLLTSAHGAQLRRLVQASGSAQRIAEAVTWIRNHFADEMRVESLADNTHMSPTSFRQHFRTMTGMSPVQFQKRLRLQQARQLMLDQSMSAGSASALVGYESASQFNREYRRLFGAPPQTDIRRALQ